MIPVDPDGMGIRMGGKGHKHTHGHGKGHKHTHLRPRT